MQRVANACLVWDLQQQWLVHQLLRAHETAVGIAGEKAQGSQDVSQARAAAQNETEIPFH
jgi:hypothetical protein